MAKKPIVGDIFEIPLSKGKNAYGQYINYSKMGPIIQVFDFISDNDAPIEKIISSKILFPPVITGLFAAIRDNIWKVIGNGQVENFIQPQFASALFNQRTGTVIRWSLWDGDKFLRLGSQLPPEFKTLEYLVVWNPSDVVNRIETGEIPFPYGELIKNNKFTPRA